MEIQKFAKESLQREKKLKGVSQKASNEVLKEKEESSGVLNNVVGFLNDLFSED